jgi:carboxyl-terminal processing protease
MTETKRALVALAGVFLCTGAVVGGVRLRDWVDHKPTEISSDLPMGNLVASREANNPIPEGDYFFELVQLLKREYVDQIQDEQKLASGAVRGMISSLGDPNSMYMEKPEFDAFLDARQGSYQGIGADFALTVKGPVNPDAARQKEQGDGNGGAEEALATIPRIPRLTVVALTPGGPAEKAGVKVGDYVYSVDSHWLVNTDLILKFREAQKKFEAKKIPLTELNKLRNEVRSKTERALLPQKARAKLSTGIEGAVDIVWERNGTFRNTTINKAASQMTKTGVTLPGTIVVRFDSKATAELKAAVAGKSDVTLDLRNNVNGDFRAMKACLGLVAPAGKYGFLATNRQSRPATLVVPQGQGATSPPKLRLLVDESTRGSAEIFALALSTFAHATLVGRETGGDRTVKQIVQLPDGSGYTLVTSEYRVSAADAKAKKS